MKIKSLSSLHLFCACLMLVLVAILFVQPAMAEIGTQDMGVTNKLVASANTTANLGSGVKVDNQDQVGIQLTGQGSASGTGNIITYIARSVDGTNYETAPPIIWSIPANGTTAVVAYTNLNRDALGSAGYIKPFQMTNANGTADFTNITLKVIKKRLR